jgi:sarcosine oxidase delta subunit
MSGCCVPQNYGINGCSICGSVVRFDGPEANSYVRRREETQKKILARNRNGNLQKNWRNLSGCRTMYVPERDGIQDELW